MQDRKDRFSESDIPNSGDFIRLGDASKELVSRWN